MRQHAASGALRVKNDMSDDVRVLEIKNVRRSHTIKLDDVKTLWATAVMDGKAPELWLYFDEGKYVLKCVVERAMK